MSDSKRKILNERVLKAPLLKFSINKEIDVLKKEQIWIEGDRNAIKILVYV